MGSEEGETVCLDNAFNGFEGAGKEDGRRGGRTNLGDYCYIVSPFLTQRLAVRIIFFLYTLA